jgi:hypothetical protein
MEATCSIAFKEWAVMCEALASGAQTLILRKGGIHEGRDGFRVARNEFWLFPTYLHQEEQWKLAEAAWPSLEKTIRDRPESEIVPIQYLIEVTDVIEITDENRLPRLAEIHWWSEQTLTDRFHYRNPGLFLLIVRMFKLPSARLLENTPHFAGCRSWVDFPQPIATTGVQPVLSDAEFETQRSRIQSSMAQ